MLPEHGRGTDEHQLFDYGAFARGDLGAGDSERNSFGSGAE